MGILALTTSKEMKNIFTVFQIFAFYFYKGTGQSTGEPYFHICGEKSQLDCTDSGAGLISNYDSVFQFSSNLKEGGLDLCTGEFTAGVTGTYAISWSWTGSVKMRLYKRVVMVYHYTTYMYDPVSSDSRTN